MPPSEQVPRPETGSFDLLRDRTSRSPPFRPMGCRSFAALPLGLRYSKAQAGLKAERRGLHDSGIGSNDAAC